MDDKLEITMTKLQKDIEYLKEGSDQNTVEHSVIMKKIDSWISSADKIYAKNDTQWAERFLLWAGAIAGGTFLIGLIALIGKAYLQLS